MITGSFTLVGIEDMYAYIITCSSGSTIPTKADGTCKSTVTVSFKKKTDEGLVVFAAPKVIISVSDSGGTELATMTYTNRNAVDVTEMINTAGINSYTLNVSLYDGNLLLASENFLINRDTDVYKFESSTGSVVQCDEHGNVIGNVVISVYKNDEPYKEYIQVIMLNKDDSRIRTFVFNTSEKDITENIKATISENKIAPYKILVESHPSLAKISIPDMILTVTYRTPTYIYGKSPWEESNVYKNGNYIEYEGLIYLWDYPIAGNSTLNPKEDVAQNPLTTKWKVYPIDDLLAARVLLADFAKVGQAVFQGNYMLSQQGTDADGNPSSSYDKFNPSTNAFNPNILLDFMTGKARLNDLEANGSVSTKRDGRRITIDAKTNTVKMISESETGYLESLVMGFTEVASKILPYIEMLNSIGERVNIRPDSLHMYKNESTSALFSRDSINMSNTSNDNVIVTAQGISLVGVPDGGDPVYKNKSTRISSDNITVSNLMNLNSIEIGSDKIKISKDGEQKTGANFEILVRGNYPDDEPEQSERTFKLKFVNGIFVL